VVQSKETDPVWVPPDWHYVEMAKKKQLGFTKLLRGQKIPVGGGAVVTVDGTDVVTKYPDGREVPFETKEGNEIVANGNVIIPPFGTNQRKYLGTLGVERLYLGDGYGLHGTDEPESIGQSASHGCVRLRNEDIETLYRIVPIGTVVYIY
jgi:lipoprotein-anchoring transpeptidase ErfK/SrfK